MYSESNPSVTREEPREKPDSELEWGEWKLVGEVGKKYCPDDPDCANNTCETSTELRGCGTKLYSPSLQFCQSPDVVEELCGTATYPSTEECCGSTKYTLATQFCDFRDGKPYKFVAINAQTWMAENLNYDVPGVTTDVCYSNEPANCDKYGRLYDWATAMDNSASSSANSGVRGVCPSGWHLPSDAEWTALATTATGGAARRTMLTSPTRETGFPRFCLTS